MNDPTRPCCRLPVAHRSRSTTRWSCWPPPGSRPAGPGGTANSVLAASSTDVAHLTSTSLPALAGSALWIAGGLPCLSALGFVLVRSALERRAGPGRTAGVFALGHVPATLATEIAVGLAVAAGHLPPSSPHRLDYGISFGLMATLGAPTGLITHPLRWTLLAATTAVFVQTNAHLARLVFDRQQTNRLLITLLQGLNIPDPQHHQPTPPPGQLPLAPS